MKMKRLLLWLMVVFVSILIITSFSFAEKNTLGLEKNALKGRNIGLAQLLMSTSYHSSMTDEFEALAEEYGFNFTFYDANFVIERQLSQAEDLISKGSEVLILNPCGDEAVSPILNLSNKAGIPLICVDNTSPSEGYIYVGINNFAIARAIGRYIGSKMGGGKIVYLRSIPSDTGCPALRWGGIQGGLGDSGELSGFDLIDERFAGTAVDEATGLTQMEDLLSANDHIDIVVAHHDAQALGAITAIRNSGREDIKMLAGFDGELRMLEEIKKAEGGSKGVFDLVTGLNSPAMIADITIRVINDIFLGKSVGSTYYIPVVAISYNNVDEYMKYGF